MFREGPRGTGASLGDENDSFFNMMSAGGNPESHKNGNMFSFGEFESRDYQLNREVRKRADRGRRRGGPSNMFERGGFKNGRYPKGNLYS